MNSYQKKWFDQIGVKKLIEGWNVAKNGALFVHKDMDLSEICHGDKSEAKENLWKFYLSGFIFIIPHLQYPELELCCLHCKGAFNYVGLANPVARKVHDIYDTKYLISCDYRCSCKTGMSRSTSQKFLDSLPSQSKLFLETVYPVKTRASSCISNEFLDFILVQMTNRTSLGEIAGFFNACRNSQYLQRKALFKLKFGNDALSSFSEFDDSKGYDGNYITQTYVQSIFIEFVASVNKYTSNALINQPIPNVISFDHTFKTATRTLDSSDNAVLIVMASKNKPQ